MKKERKGPRPIHNYVFPRSISPSHAPVSPTRPPRPTRIRVSGCVHRFLRESWALIGARKLGAIAVAIKWK